MFWEEVYRKTEEYKEKGYRIDMVGSPSSLRRRGSR